MKRSIALAASLFSLAFTAPAFGLSLTLENQSEWEIHELYFSPADETEWGPDQLGEEVVKSGEAFQLTKIDKGNYDIKIVDEDGDNCIVQDVDFRASEKFALTDKLLLGCQAATAAEEEE